MELFELGEWQGELIENYSHGMKQRLVMSAALLHCPKALVVDEPMVGLDPRGARLVKEVFRREARQRGGSVFMSTHTLEVAQEMCDRIAIIQRGRVIAMGTPAELQKMAGGEHRDLESIFLRLTGGEDMQGVLRALRSASS
jgi:ABC-2 type transport system ATP-binding protein